MAEEKDFQDSYTRDQIKAMMNSGIKSIYDRDLAGRIETMYEGPLTVEIGDPCIRTKYKFIDGAGGNSQQIIAWEEEVVAWPGYGILPTYTAGDPNDIDNLS